MALLLAPDCWVAALLLPLPVPNVCVVCLMVAALLEPTWTVAWVLPPFAWLILAPFWLPVWLTDDALVSLAACAAVVAPKLPEVLPPCLTETTLLSPI